MSSHGDVVILPAWSVLRVVGPDAASWLNGIVTADVTAILPGVGAWSLLLSKQGKIEAELIILGRSDELFVVVSGGSAVHTLETLSHHLVMEDAEIFLEEGLGVIGAVGETSATALLQTPGTVSVPGIGVPLTLGVISDPAGVARALVLSTGAEERTGEEAYLRVHWGWPVYDRDYSVKDNPHDATLERRAISWSKGCYLGQEVVCMLDMRGKVKRRLVRLRGSLPVSLEIGTEVLDEDGTLAGRVTSVGEGELLAQISAPYFERPRLRVLGSDLELTSLS